MLQMALWTLKTRGIPCFRSELALVPSNSTQHTTSPVLGDHHNRWSPKAWAK